MLDDAYINLLRTQLDSPDRTECAEAVRELGRIPCPETVEALREFLDRSTDQNLRGMAAKALSNVGDLHTLPVFIELFDEPHLRPVIVKAFLRLGIFDDALPPSGRERRRFRRALMCARPEILELVKRGKPTTAELRRVLPPFM